jgi:hypothetical protein
MVYFAAYTKNKNELIACRFDWLLVTDQNTLFMARYLEPTWQIKRAEK